MEFILAERMQSIFVQQKKIADSTWDLDAVEEQKEQSLQKIIDREVVSLAENHKARILSEFNGYGCLDVLLDDEQITEILVNSYDQVFFEKSGKLFRSTDHFFSEQTYAAVLDRLSQKCHSYLNREKPFVEAQFGKWRITILFSELSRGSTLLSIRKQPNDRWTLDRLRELDWCSDKQFELIKNIFKTKKNFLVVGGTGSGKTSLLQSLLQQFSEFERAVIIEDTQELHLPNAVCCSLLTRQDPSGAVGDVTMDDLLKRALRLRPDRLVIGEIRGAEAKSLLMALATGHDGSFGSMHARTAQEALLRLEMLIQMGAPQWNLKSIRNLIAMTLQVIFVVEKVDGKRQLRGIYEVTSVEDTGILLQQIDDTL
ncbi:MAG: CpaF family protein [Bdellovibrio sp.]|nr:CpaF family protein [Bdellovibrio sp.]